MRPLARSLQLPLHCQMPLGSQNLCVPSSLEGGGDRGEAQGLQEAEELPKVKWSARPEQGLR